MNKYLKDILKLLAIVYVTDKNKSKQVLTCLSDVSNYILNKEETIKEDAPHQPERLRNSIYELVPGNTPSYYSPVIAVVPYISYDKKLKPKAVTLTKTATVMLKNYNRLEKKLVALLEACEYYASSYVRFEQYKDSVLSNFFVLPIAATSKEFPEVPLKKHICIYSKIEKELIELYPLKRFSVFDVYYELKEVLRIVYSTNVHNTKTEKRAKSYVDKVLKDIDVDSIYSTEIIKYWGSFTRPPW